MKCLQSFKIICSQFFNSTEADKTQTVTRRSNQFVLICRLMHFFSISSIFYMKLKYGISGFLFAMFLRGPWDSQQICSSDSHALEAMYILIAVHYLVKSFRLSPLAERASQPN